MATIEDARRIALALPGVEETTSFRHAAWSIGGTKFAWERPFTKADRARDGDPPPGDLLAVALEDEHEKHALVAGEPLIFRSLAHFDGYAIVLVRLARTPPARLEQIVRESYERVAASDGQ